MSKVPDRRSLEDTWRYLEELGGEMPRHPDGSPFVLPRMPSYDDEVRRCSFFRQILQDLDVSNLSLPRTYFCRSSFERVDFRNTDLSESRMCWNDFVSCDFSDADLSGCDMRASDFKDCKFTRATLKGADLRQSRFEGCDFTDANMSGTTAEEENDDLLDSLSEEQQDSVEWKEEPGPEPDGG